MSIRAQLQKKKQEIDDEQRTAQATVDACILSIEEIDRRRLDELARKSAAEESLLRLMEQSEVIGRTLSSLDDLAKLGIDLPAAPSLPDGDFDPFAEEEPVVEAAVAPQPAQTAAPVLLPPAPAAEPAVRNAGLQPRRVISSAAGQAQQPPPARTSAPALRTETHTVLHLATWLERFLNAHQTSDFTVAQLVQAAERAGVEKTQSAMAKRIRLALNAREDNGTVERREAGRGVTYRAVRTFPRNDPRHTDQRSN